VSWQTWQERIPTAFRYFVLKFDMKENFCKRAVLTSLSLVGLPLRSTYLFLWTKCIPRGRFPINVKKLEYIKMLKEYISTIS
jgi:hypothetical protein